jgi:signal transduction histidine kinase
MSHELRTPLNGIIGFSEILVDGKVGALNATQKEYLGDVLASGRHLLRLINGVLDLSKIEAGRMDLLPETFVLRAAIDEACAVATNAASDKSIHLLVDVAADIAEVTLDRHKFMQILYNLLSNAFKFSNKDGQVELGAYRQGDTLRLDVRDSGVGIRAEDLPKLFAEFQQLDSGAARRQQGTGLGLALTRRLAELHGGSVHVESTAGVGSCFTVILPMTMKQQEG